MTADQALIAFMAAVILGMVAAGLIGDWWDRHPRFDGFLDWLTGTRPDYSVTNDLREPGQLPDVDDAGRWRA